MYLRYLCFYLCCNSSNVVFEAPESPQIQCNCNLTIEISNERGGSMESRHQPWSGTQPTLTLTTPILTPNPNPNS
jgi:hypothetical protein